MAGVGLRRRGIGRGDDLPLSADINVTSLVDVAFTLLVIFIITAPILQGGVEVNLPQADVRPVTSAEDMFIVSIRRDGRVFLEDTEMTIEAFKEGFAQLAEAAGTQRVYLRGDEEAMWGVGVEVVAAIVNAGVGVSLIAEPTPLQRSR